MATGKGKACTGSTNISSSDYDLKKMNGSGKVNARSRLPAGKGMLWTASLGSNSGAGIKIRIGMLVSFFVKCRIC
jgi:hypothetical protein